MTRQARLVASCGVLVEDSLVDRLVDCGNGREEEFYALALVSLGYRVSELLDLGSQVATVCAIDLILLFVLSDALDC